jgi:vacuolar-type H+-ATPase subunit C/Vma6
MKQRVSDLEYVFAVGKIRALGKFLIKEEVFTEALRGDLAGAVRLFAEAGIYGDELLTVRSSDQADAFFSNELRTLKGLIQRLLLDEKLHTLLDVRTVAQAHETVVDFGRAFLTDYVFHLIDMHNIKTFLRLQAVSAPPDELIRRIGAEGFAGKDFFLKSFVQDRTVFLHGLEHMRKRGAPLDYASVLGEAIAVLEKTGSFIALEAAMAGYLMQALRPARYINFGPEPVLAYYFGRVNEINLMRMIILAKLNDVSSELVQERMAGVYA